MYEEEEEDEEDEESYLQTIKQQRRKRKERDETEGEPLYCYCRQVSFGEMVGCDGEVKSHIITNGGGQFINIWGL